jgi:hypothetical protein
MNQDLAAIVELKAVFCGNINIEIDGDGLSRLWVLELYLVV